MNALAKQETSKRLNQSVMAMNGVTSGIDFNHQESINNQSVLSDHPPTINHQALVALKQLEKKHSYQTSNERTNIVSNIAMQKKKSVSMDMDDINKMLDAKSNFRSRVKQYGKWYLQPTKFNRHFDEQR